MPNIKLKGQTGEVLTYEDVERVYFDSADKDGEVVYYTHGKVLEDVTIEPDFSEGDQVISVPDGSLVKEATIVKPAELVPENIRYGTTVAGVDGELIGDTEEVTVDLDMAEGGQVITPSAEGKAMSKVVVTKPEAMLPENIRKDVNIGGVVGDFIGDTEEVSVDLNFPSDAEGIADMVVMPSAEDKVLSIVTIAKPADLLPENIRSGKNIGGVEGTLVPNPYIEYTYNEEGQVVAASMHGFTEIPAGCFAYMTALTSCDLSGSPGITSIGERAFQGCSSLTDFDIPNTVTSIGNYAFYQCANLASIDIPDGIMSIGEAAFRECTVLENIAIPDSVTSIGKNAFNACKAITSIAIPDSVTSVDGSVFQNCTALESVTIGSGVTSIGTSAFSGCTALTSITLPDSVTSIGASAFYNCTTLESVNIPDGLTSIANYTFQQCYALTSITLPDSVTSIGVGAFYKCTALASVIVPDSVTSIGGQAFYGCTELASVTIGSGVTSIANQAFGNCTALTSATFKDTTTWYVGTSAGATTTQVSVTNASTAATYLRSTHYSKYWTKV